MSETTLRGQLLEHPPCGCGPETVCAAHRALPEPEYPRDNAIARAIVQVWPDHRTRPTMHEALRFLQLLEAASYDSAALAFVRGLDEAEAQGVSLEDFLGRAPLSGSDYAILRRAGQEQRLRDTIETVVAQAERAS